MLSLKRVVYSIIPIFLMDWLRARRWRAMFQSGALEDEQSILGQFVKAGDNAIDIGANLGAYTKTLAELIAPGKVFAIEPVPYTYNILLKNIEQAKLTNVIPLQCAVTSENGSAIIEIPKFGTGGDSFYEAHISPQPTAGLRSFSVPAQSLDTIWIGAGRPQIAFVKCDVEGHELNVLRGATELIQRDTPVWLIEVKGDPDIAGAHAYAVLTLLEQIGYRTYLLRDGTLNLRVRGQASLNYFFLPKRVSANSTDA